MIQQLALDLAPTPAMINGEAPASVWQCAQCGALVATGMTRSAPAGLCPCCLRAPKVGSAWWEQTIPVGPFEVKS